jgi:hypothetical protein
MRTLIALLFCLCATSALAFERPSDSTVRQMMIEDSQRAYRGNCPCPEFSASNGSRCGGRSAYSKSGSGRVLCYPGDISPEQLQRYREQHRLQ